MPTPNPRLTITLQPSTAVQIAELSRLTGSSQSSIIAELLEQSSPVFERMIRLLSAAVKAKEEMRDQVVADMDAAQARIEKQLGLALGEFDQVTGNLLDQVEAVRRRARRGAGGTRSAGGAAPRSGLRTPPSNRGVRSTANPRKAAKAQGRK